MSEAEAALYEAPFQHLLAHVKPERIKNNREAVSRELVAPRRIKAGDVADNWKGSPDHSDAGSY